MALPPRKPQPNAPAPGGAPTGGSAQRPGAPGAQPAQQGPATQPPAFDPTRKGAQNAKAPQITPPNLDPKVNNGPSPEVVDPPPVMKHDGSGTFIPRIAPSDPSSLDTHVTVGYCLEAFARVMEELAEKQEDPVWVQAHLTLAQEWHAMVDSLLTHQTNMEQTRGETELKQQQMVHTDMDHQMNLAHQDKMNQQQLVQQQQQHEQNMKMQDQMNKQKLTQQQTMDKHTATTAQQQSKMTAQQQMEAHKQKMAFNDQANKSKLQQPQSRMAQPNKPTPGS